MKKPVDYADLFRQHEAVLETISHQLAINFEVPAQRLINHGFALMGLARFTRAGDDLWEMYKAHTNDWEYVKPTKALRARWENA